MRNKLLISYTVILIIICTQAFAFQEDTHNAINQYDAQLTEGFSLNAYLINGLGLTDGYRSFINGTDADGNKQNQPIIWWLGYGGEKEDKPGGSLEQYWRYVVNSARNNNHFHNPLKDWANAGLSEYLFALNSSKMEMVYGK